MELTRVMSMRGNGTESASLAVDAEVLRRAEAAVAAMRDEYLGWLRQDVVRFESLLRQAQGSDDDGGIEIEAMLRIAHDMRGQGGTFGFPRVSEVATSLCRLLRGRETTASSLAGDLDLAGRHIAVVRSLLAEDSDKDVRDLVAGLERAVAERNT